MGVSGDTEELIRGSVQLSSPRQGPFQQRKIATPTSTAPRGRGGGGSRWLRGVVGGLSGARFQEV